MARRCASLSSSATKSSASFGKNLLTTSKRIGNSRSGIKSIISTIWAFSVIAGNLPCKHHLVARFFQSGSFLSQDMRIRSSRAANTQPIKFTAAFESFRVTLRQSLDRLLHAVFCWSIHRFNDFHSHSCISYFHKAFSSSANTAASPLDAMTVVLCQINYSKKRWPAPSLSFLPFTDPCHGPSTRVRCRAWRPLPRGRGACRNCACRWRVRVRASPCPSRSRASAARA